MRVSINGSDLLNLENPFNQIPIESFSSYSNDEFACKTTKIPLPGDYDGVFVYKINRLVKRVSIKNISGLGKRSFSQANSTVTGLATVFQLAATTIDKSDFQHKSITRKLKRLL